MTPFEQAVYLAMQKGLVASKEEVDERKSLVGIDVVTLFDLKGQKVARFSLRELASAVTPQELEEVVLPPDANSICANQEASPKKKFEYKFIRADLKGRGITLEINLLDIDGVRVSGWGDDKGKGFTLPALLQRLGSQGWEMVNHTVNQDNKSNLVTLHYFSFKREV